MSLKTEERTIGDHVFTVTQLGGRKAVKLNNRIARAVFPALGKLEGDKGHVGGAMELFFSLLPEDQFDAVANELLSTVKCDGKDFGPALQDEVFAGNVTLYYQLLFFSLEVNFSDFFGGIVAKLAAASKEKASSPG